MEGFIFNRSHSDYGWPGLLTGSGCCVFFLRSFWEESPPRDSFLASFPGHFKLKIRSVQVSALAKDS